MSERAAVSYYVSLIQPNGIEPIDLTDRVEAFEFTDREQGMGKLRLTVDNKDLSNFEVPLFEFGSRLRVSWSNGGSSSPIRDVVVRKVTGGRTLTVEAVDKNGSLLDTVKKRRSFFSKTRSEVVSEIAEENGFGGIGSERLDIQDTFETFNEIHQSNLTDGQLIKKLADLEGFQFYVDADGIHWKYRDFAQPPVREYIYFIDPGIGEIIDFNITNDITRRPARVTVKSRDPRNKEDIEAVADNESDPDRTTLAPAVISLTSEDAVVSVKREVAQETTIHSNVETQNDAEREAKGKYRKAQQLAVKMTLKLRGDPSLQAKTIIRLSGMGKRISGLYYIKEIKHSLTASGGYEMNTKLITDGFQRKAGKGKGASSDDAVAALPECGNRLLAAAKADFSLDFQTEDAVLADNTNDLRNILTAAERFAGALNALSNKGGDELKQLASQLSGALLRLASAARSARATTVVEVATECASILKRISESEDDIAAQGRQNKAAGDSEETPAPVDKDAARPERGKDIDGRDVTRYDVDKRPKAGNGSGLFGNELDTSGLGGGGGFGAFGGG